MNITKHQNYTYLLPMYSSFSRCDWIEETGELGEVTAHADRVGYEPISSTLWRQREDYCVILISLCQFH